MKRFLLPIFLLLAGTGAGVGAAIAMKPAADSDPVTPDALAATDLPPCGPDVSQGGMAASDSAVQPDAATGPTAFAKLENQFVIPVIEEGAISAMVVLSLSIEVPEDGADTVALVEPKLRDQLLEAMFEHANIGGFSGNFTESAKMRILRQDLLRVTREIVPGKVHDVLVVDIVRQDV